MTIEQDQRRSFLKHIMIGAAVVAGSTAAIRPAGDKSASGKQEDREVLYHESERFKKYYESLLS